ncbi:MAG: DUF3108 domain-containing protein [Pseudomonadota bacterium]
MAAATHRLIIAIVVLSIGSAHATVEPRPFEAVYSGRFSGIRIEIEAGRYTSGDAIAFRRYSEPRGLARLIRRDGALECGTFMWANDGIQPQYYAYVDGKPGKGKSVTVRFDDGTAASTYRSAAVELDVADGAFDKIVEEHIVAQRLDNGETDFTLRVVDRNEVHNVAYKGLGTETIKVDAGSYETVVIERRRGNSSRTTRIWAAPALGYQPVRIQRLKDGKVQGTANLKSFAWLDQARGSVTPVCP